MKIKLGFVVIVKEADPRVHRSLIKTPQLDIHVVCVSTYKQAIRISKELVNQSVTLLDLCGGFGHEGVAAIAKAVKGKANVAVARDDKPLVLKGKSGDDIFA